MNGSKQFKRTQWLMLFTLMFCYMFYYCGRQNFSFAILGIQQTLHLTPTDTGFISAGLLLFYGVGQLINGYFGDYYSVRTLVTLGACLSFFLNILVSFAHSFWILFLLCSLIGYAQSLAFAPGTKLITNWFRQEERGQVFGLYLSASGFALIIAYAVCLIVIKFLPWQWLFRLPVMLLLISSVIFYVVVRDKPETMGFPPIHQPLKTQKIVHSSTDYYFIFTHFRFQMACIAMGCCSLARYGLLIWIPVLYLGEKPTESPWLSMTLPAGMALGAIVVGTISDKWFGADRIKPTVLFMTIASCLMILLYLLPAQWSLLGSFILFLAGFFIFGPQSALFALCPDLLGVRLTSTGVGVMNAYGSAFSAFGEAVIGYLINYTHHVAIMYVVVFCACVIATISALLAIPRKSIAPQELILSKQ